MKKITISDMTLTKSHSLTFKEKIQIARKLDALSVDVIHMPEICSEKTDSLLIRTVSAFVKNSTVAVTVGRNDNGVEVAAAAIAGAKKGRLVLSLTVSPVGMEYVYHKKPAKMLEYAKELFAKATAAAGEVELLAEDATRADKKFLAELFSLAVDAGISVITLTDEEGILLPDEIAEFVTDIKNSIPSLASVKLGILCKNTNGCGIASSASAARSGADEVKTAVSLEDFSDTATFLTLIRSAGARLSLSVEINQNEAQHLTEEISRIVNKKSIPAAELAQRGNEDTSVFDKNDSEDTVKQAVCSLGYDLSEDDLSAVYQEFLRVADKKQVKLRDIEAIVASVAHQAPPTYQLQSYVINNGNIISSSAQIQLKKDGELLSGISMGDGPIDAAFRTLEQIIGHHFELDDFQIQSVTEGREAVGEALVRLRSNGALYSGNGISTDIIGASIRAYLNAVNKIVYEEKCK